MTGVSLLRRLALAAMAVLSSFVGLGLAGAEDAVSVDQHVALANQALKQSTFPGKADYAKLGAWLSHRQFNELERFYGRIFQLLKQDIRYESCVTAAYGIFSQGVSLADLDAWVDETHSDIAYTARGLYKMRMGINIRGTTTIDKVTPEESQSMEDWHAQATADLQLAIQKNPKSIMAYDGLLTIASNTLSESLPKSDILEKALDADPRSYQIRATYLFFLKPRWGGSYQEMREFAQDSQQFLELNPRLLNLKGGVDDDLADLAITDRKYDLALKHYTAALQYGDRVLWLVARGACYYHKKQFDKALVDFKKALFYDPQDRDAIEWLDYARGAIDGRYPFKG